MDVRLLAAILVSVSSICGCAVGYMWRGRPHAMLLVKVFSAGVIASLALVHIVSESVVALLAVSDYPLGGVCALGGLLGMMILEHASHAFGPGGQPAAVESTGQPAAAAAAAAVEAGQLHVAPSVASDSNAGEPCGLGRDEPHQHSCIVNLSTGSLVSNLLSASTTTTTTTTTCDAGRHAAKAEQAEPVYAVYVFEFACVFHSVFIGISVGANADADSATKMAIAVIFHQLLEGLSLGFVLRTSAMSLPRVVVMIVLYSLTTPCGIGAGMAMVSGDGDGDATSARTVAPGCLQGVSGGMLLYVALFQILAEEFSKQELHRRARVAASASMYAALLLGAGAMCALAVWL